jgi:hypothetical protein
MGDRGFIIEYVRSCTVGTLGLTDCWPVWQCAAIAALLVFAIATIVVFRLRNSVRAQ